jgi:hypothetical protein
MKKRNIIISIALSAILLAILTIPTIHASGQKYNCICNHYNANDVNTVYDEATGVGVTGSISDYGSYFWLISYSFVRDLGGYYQPAPPNDNLMYIHYEWTDTGTNSHNDITYNYPTNPSWIHPYYPFGSFAYYGQQDNVAFWTNQGTYAGGSASSWFEWPPYPSAMWYDQGSLTSVSMP